MKKYAKMILGCLVGMICFWGIDGIDHTYGASSNMQLMTTSEAEEGMHISDEGMELLKKFEGCRLTAYKAVATETYYTIGYGHYGPDVKKDMIITQEEADALFREDLKTFDGYVNDFLKKNQITLNQKQFDALVSFTYNLGPGWMTRTTTIGTYLKKGISNYTNQQIVDALIMWNTSGGVVLKALTMRRWIEAVYFLGGVDGAYTVTIDSLNIRKGPATSYEKVGVVKAGEKVSITEIKNTGTIWGKTSKGWICLHNGTTSYCNFDSPIAMIVGIVNKVTGVKIRWTPGPEAASYHVMRQTGKEDPVKIANTKGVTYEDTEVESGKSYTYFVYPLDANGNVSEGNEEFSKQTITFIEAPKPLTIKSANKGVALTWEKVKGKKYYVIYRKSTTEGWKRLGTTKTNAYSDKTAESGTTYRYRIYSVSEDLVRSGYYTDNCVITFYARPEGIVVTNVESGIHIKWTPSNGATKYMIFRKLDDKESQWKAIIATKKKSFVDKKVKRGVKYCYTVCVVSNDKKTNLSMYNPLGKSIMRMGTTNFSLNRKKSGISITWKSVKGATRYWVMRRIKGTSQWKCIAKISAGKERKYTDTTVKKGTTYEYKVYALEGAGKNYVVEKMIKR